MPGPTDEELERLGRAIRGSRTQFQAIYDPIANERRCRSLQLIEVLSPRHPAPYFAALKQAADGDWLDQLAAKLFDAGVLPSEPPAIASNEVLVEPQAVIDAALGFPDAETFVLGIRTALRRVCRIHRRGTFAGTGFLVGPQTVLTAWHVIEPLLHDREPALGSSAHLTVEFKNDHAGRTCLRRVQDDWLVDRSPIHPAEAAGVPVDLAAIHADELGTHLDYAVIRLVEVEGRTRGFYRLDRNRKPTTKAPGSQIVLYQHPNGARLKVTTGACVEPGQVNLETRVRHTANSMPGSSGGLIVDKEFEPIALHQCSVAPVQGALVNGAIPTACIAASGRNLEEVTGADPVCELRNGEAVIGRVAFQNMVFDALSTNGRRIIVVDGETDSGKSFSVPLLKTLVDGSEHHVTELNATEISVESENLARTLLKKLTPDGEVDLPSAAEADTAHDGWIRDVLFPKLADGIRRAAGRRTIWLAIDDLHKTSVPRTSARHLLEEIYRNIRSLPFLRIVLIGLRGSVPGAAPNDVTYDQLTRITTDEIHTYVQRRLTQRDQTIADDDLARFVALIERNIHRNAESRSVRRVVALVEDGLATLVQGAA